MYMYPFYGQMSTWEIYTHLWLRDWLLVIRREVVSVLSVQCHRSGPGAASLVHTKCDNITVKVSV